MIDNDYVTNKELRAALAKTEARLEAKIQTAFNEMAEIFKDGLQMIAERFDRIEVRMDRMEDKLDQTAARTELQAVDIRQLRRKTGLA